jgi:hypothetical protein
MTINYNDNEHTMKYNERTLSCIMTMNVRWHTSRWWPCAHRITMGLYTAAAEKPSQLLHSKLGSWRAGPRLHTVKYVVFTSIYLYLR